MDWFDEDAGDRNPRAPVVEGGLALPEWPRAHRRESIVDRADVLADLSDLCRAAGLVEMAKAAYDLWLGVQLEHRDELLEAEKRWT